MDDSALESQETFAIIATTDVPLVTFTGQNIAIVVLEDDTDSM